MSHLREHFEILGITEQSSLEDAVLSYKDLIRVWHPDRFGHDPRLRRKAEEHTGRLNVAMAAARQFFKNPSSHNAQREAERSGDRAPHVAQPVAASIGTTLAVHQRRSVSLRHVLTGSALLYLGMWMSIEHPGMAIQVALGIVISGYGFSTALVGAALLCFARPLISVTNSSIRVLGRPSIPLEQIAASHLIVTTKGSLFTLLASPHYVKKTPLPLRIWLRANALVRRSHYEARASILDTHPVLIIDTLANLAAQGVVRPPVHFHTPSSWGSYVSLLSIVALAVPVIRTLVEGTLPPAAILSYLLLFALLQTIAVIKTIVLAPTR